MRIAILIQGDPRFCEEFDHFLEKLAGYTQVDWFFYLWKNNAPTNNVQGGAGHELISPCWQNPTHDWAIKKIKENLPEHHRVAGFCLADQNSLKITEITNNYAVETIQSNVWKMWYSQYRADQMRLEYEQGLEFTYDIVIRSRPDLMICDLLNLHDIKNQIDNDPDTIIMPRNRHCGYGVGVCDLFGIGSSKSMTVYTDLYNQALDHHARGVKFHPETMLGKHLSYNNIKYIKGNFNVEIRTLGDWQHRDTGVIYTASQLIEQRLRWEDHRYISNFGRWE
jgi:hypothetical protein